MYTDAEDLYVTGRGQNLRHIYAFVCFGSLDLESVLTINNLQLIYTEAIRTCFRFTVLTCVPAAVSGVARKRADV